MSDAKEKVIQTMQNLRRLDKPTVKLTISNEPTTITDSKIGGTPYIPKNEKLPLSTYGDELRIIAQINLDQLAGNVFPIKTGILQFWAESEDLYGCDFDEGQKQDKFRVIYYPTIQEHYSKEELEAEYTSLTDEGEEFPFSIDTCFKLSGTEEVATISTYDDKFDDLFLEEYKKLDPTVTATNCWDLEKSFTREDFDFEELVAEYSPDGHRLLGYPYFTQSDPRFTDELEEYILLLQLDTDSIDDKEIMWGDSGVGNWFIHPDDLAKADFSKVLYNWDCC